ncbi:MAG: potassium transporter Kup [Azospirillum sp.]|nr:potassium transporter Kup [Azospirillum sp.]
MLASGLAALGIVYGDIGTSPLYAFRLAIRTTAGEGAPAEAQVLGVLSLIVWSLILVISVKYVVFVMRADNSGEGGILALLALARSWTRATGRLGAAVFASGVFGAALLYGDGVITPAISVLSAVEGLSVATPWFDPYILPISAVILIALFAIQYRGTARIGRMFGPIMVGWFGALALLGVASLVRAPRVLAALDPRWGLALIGDAGWSAFFIIGAVFLAVTGGEALYADMGHVGRRPIRLTWSCFVLPALVLNYAGQAALVLAEPGPIGNPFFRLAPGWLVLPLVALATAATVIASQALISGVFSLTRQAINMGLWPRLKIVQTSAEGYGQIYLPVVNWGMLGLVLVMVMSFRSSDNLAAAYGIAVSSTMLITTILLYAAMRGRWHWPGLAAIALTLAFLAVDLAFLGANLLKLPEGGWLPVAAGIAMYLVMEIWQHGNDYVHRRVAATTAPLAAILEHLDTAGVVRISGVGVFLAKSSSDMPPMMVHHLRHNRVLHQTVIVLSIAVAEVPRVPARERLTVEDLGHGFWRVVAHYGFMQTPNIPVALRDCQLLGLDFDPEQATFYLGHETIIRSADHPAMSGLAEWLFAFMARNATNPTEFFKIPDTEVVEIGFRVEI